MPQLSKLSNNMSDWYDCDRCYNKTKTLVFSNDSKDTRGLCIKCHGLRLLFKRIFSVQFLEIILLIISLILTFIFVLFL